MAEELERRVKLSQVADGVAEEMFQQEFAKLLDNAMDPNTPSKAKRSIILKIDLTIDEKRENPELHISCMSKLGAVAPVKRPIRIGLHHGQLAAVDTMSQTEMFNEPAGRPSGVVEGGAGR